VDLERALGEMKPRLNEALAGKAAAEVRAGLPARW
jgi:hypothetical protein